jgi:hypothetical protein
MLRVAGESLEFATLSNAYKSSASRLRQRPWSRANVQNLGGALAGSLVYDTGFPFQQGNSREPGFESRRPHQESARAASRVAVTTLVELESQVVDPDAVDRASRIPVHDQNDLVPLMVISNEPDWHV